jgi:pimeloyl-ACP methyl ester carboxylesterase
MSTQPAHAVRQESTLSPEDFATGFVTSRDGTTVGYRQFGGGPGLIVLHGTMSSGYHHVDLAEALADAFTVFVVDRRGRGLSGPAGPDYGIAREVEDVDALIGATGADALFGVSSGAIIALQAAAALPALRRIAIYEPPLFVERGAPAAVLARFDREIASGRVPAALMTAMEGAEMGPALFRAMPRWLTERLTDMMLRQEDRKGAGPYPPMRTLAAALRLDLQLVVEMSGREEPCRAIPAEVLLLGGSRSPGYLKAALGRLEGLLPHVSRVELPGLDHAASWNVDRRGNPLPVARELRRFLAR